MKQKPRVNHILQSHHHSHIDMLRFYAKFTIHNTHSAYALDGSNVSAQMNE